MKKNNSNSKGNSKAKATAKKGAKDMKKTTVPVNALANEKRVEEVAKANAKRIEEATAAIEAQSENTLSLVAIDIAKKYKKSGGDMNAVDSLLYLAARIIVLAKINRLQAQGDRWTLSHYHLQNDIIKNTTCATADNSKAQQYSRIINSLYVTKYNTKGNAKTKCLDWTRVEDIKKLYADLDRSIANDLLHAAIIPIIEALRAVPLENVTRSTLIKPYIIVIESSKHWSDGTEKPRELWHYTATNAIKRASYAVSKTLEKERAVSIKGTSKTIEDIENDIARKLERGEDCTELRAKLSAAVSKLESNTPYIETTRDEAKPTAAERYDAHLYGDEARTYKRAPRAAVVEATQATTATVDDEAVALCDRVIKAAKLTPSQAVVFNRCIMNGETVEAVAYQRGVSIHAVNESIVRIKDKIANSGVFTAAQLEAVRIYNAKEARREAKAKAIARVSIRAVNIKTGEAKVFTSIGEAAKALKIDKNNISHVLNGARGQTGGYTFERRTA